MSHVQGLYNLCVEMELLKLEKIVTMDQIMVCLDIVIWFVMALVYWDVWIQVLITTILLLMSMMVPVVILFVEMGL